MSEAVARFLAHLIVSISAGLIVVVMTDAPHWAGAMTVILVWFCSDPVAPSAKVRK